MYVRLLGRKLVQKYELVQLETKEDVSIVTFFVIF